MFNLILRGKLNTEWQLGNNLGARRGVPARSMALGTVAQVPSSGPVTPAPARTMPGHREPPSPGRVSTQWYSPRNPGRGSVSQRPGMGAALSGCGVWVEEASRIGRKRPYSDHLFLSQTLLKQSSLGQFLKPSKEPRNSLDQKILLCPSRVLATGQSGAE